jgi:hypothetical protein
VLSTERVIEAILRPETSCCDCAFEYSRYLPQNVLQAVAGKWAIRKKAALSFR